MVSQEQFADNMSKPKLRTTVTVYAEEGTSLKSVLGAGLWLAKKTRPDLAAQVSQGQQLLPNPTLGGARTVDQESKAIQTPGMKDPAHTL